MSFSARSYLLIFLFVPRNSAIIKLDLSCHYMDIVLVSFPHPFQIWYNQNKTIGEIL
nr:MAG TPA: plekstrin-like domain protein [Caudoviricetes sp.]